MFNHSLTTDSPLKDIDLNQKAKDAKFIQRSSSKISAYGILVSLLKCVISGEGSFRQIASELATVQGKSCRRQAIFQRVNESCVTYLRHVAFSLIAKHAGKASQHCKTMGITRILTEDSTFQGMHQSNVANYPAHGNKHGATAGFKVDLIYDLLSGLPLHQELASGTHQDKLLGKRLLDLVEKDDLVLRDMGYFSLEAFQEIEQKSAYWLSRLPANVNVKTLQGRELEQLLGDKKRSVLDLTVRVGSAGLRCRLVAVRASETMANQRRRQRYAQSTNIPSQKAILRDGWHILLTNLDEQHSRERLFEIYRLRWNIEVRFKAWKQALNLQNVFRRRSNFHHQEALIYAALIFQLLTLNLAASLDLGTKCLSLENFSKEIRSMIQAITRHSPEMLFEVDLRHIVTESRRRKPLMDLAFTA